MDDINIGDVPDGFDTGSSAWSTLDSLTLEQSSDCLDLKEKSKFQAELVFNKLLPYANEIGEEADALLAKIKANLGRCVMLRNIKPGCVFWAQMLHKYIGLYGIRFTKEDHITFIKLMYELITIPNLESPLITNFGSPLYLLLRKSDVLSPNELELPWRPLYDLYCHLMVQKSMQVSFYHHPSYLNGVIESIIFSANIYFPVSATQEILDELRPEIIPFFINAMQRTVQTFNLFLPVQQLPENRAQSHELWFHEFMKLWEVDAISTFIWGNSIMQLMSRLAYYNIGYIEWEPYIPLMFTRFVQTFNFPVCYKKMTWKTSSTIEPTYMSLWIASVLGNKSSAQLYLEKFLKAIETFLQPANHGSWVKRLSELFVNLSYFVVLRLHRERYQKKATWKTPVPDSHKLTDAYIDRFVDSMIPVALIGIYSKSSRIFYDALHYLAIMRPNIVIPKVIEKCYHTIDSDMKALKITALTCMMRVSKSLVQGSRIPNKEYAFAEGPEYVQSILFAALPGIDPSDPSMCFTTFRLIATYVTMIPLVDCSQTKADLTEEELLICEKTSRFEDFAFIFMDKVLVWIESNSLEHVRLESGGPASHGRSHSEFMADMSLQRVFSALLPQISRSTFASLLSKLRGFILKGVLEIQVAGHLVCTLCRVFTQVDGTETLRVLLPILTDQILDVLGEDDEMIKSETQGNELLYPLLLLSQLVLTHGDALLPHLDTLITVIDKAIRLKSPEGNMLGCKIIGHLMTSLTDVMVYGIQRNLDDPKYPYVRDWGMTQEIKKTKLTSFVPSEKELKAAQSIFNRYFVPTIESIEEFIKTKDSLSREKLQTMLRIIYHVLQGCAPVLPFWDEPAIELQTYDLNFDKLLLKFGFEGEITMPDGSNVRKILVKTMAALQEVLLKHVEDDTKSLLLIEMIWSGLLHSKMRIIASAGNKVTTSYNVPKQLVENQMSGDYGWFPTLILSRVRSQHSLRRQFVTQALTETHVTILMNLLTLSISKYCGVRARAQETIQSSFSFYFPNASIILGPRIIEILKDPSLEHDSYKGILYLIAGAQSKSNLLVKRDWQLIRNLWPTLVLSKSSEKMSINRLKDYIMKITVETFYTTNIKLEVPDACIEVASNLWIVGMEPSGPEPTNGEIEKGKEHLEELGERNLKLYNETLDDLLQSLLQNNLHWRHRLLAMHFIYVLVHPDVTLPPKIVRYFLESLIHESIKERQISLQILLYIFKQLKKKSVKLTIDVPANDDPVNLRPGCRPDNAWLQYNYETRPTNSVAWDEPRFVHKCNVGYYAWPRELQVHAPSSEQPQPVNETPSEHEAEIVRFFSDENNVERLVNYLSLEGKGRRNIEKFSLSRLELFTGLFRNHGDAFLGSFLPHIRRLVDDKRKNMQRCAAEIICGLIRGSKRWPYEATEAMWDGLLPIIRSALRSLTAETINMWTFCLSNANKDRDPNRMHWLLECLMQESTLGEAEASIVECGRLMVLQGALSLQCWRVSELLQRLLLHLETRLGEGPFQNVRDRLAKMLVFIFRNDCKHAPEFAKGKTFPEVCDFLDKLYPKLLSLVEEDDKASPETVPQAAAMNIDDPSENKSEDLSTRSPESTGVNTLNDEREKNLRLLKTVCKWIVESVLLANANFLTSFYRIYPIICQLENNENDEELTSVCSMSIAAMSQSITPAEHVPAALEAVKKVSESNSWSARINCLEFLYVLVFHNMSILISNEVWIRDIQSIVLKLLEDERLEVREKAAQVLSGLLHCTIIPDPEALLKEFQQKAKTKIKVKRKLVSENEQDLAKNVNTLNAARLRHSGVLGMCAFIQAHPYDFPKHIPPIFEYLNDHLNDPEPIPSTIRKTLNEFKRTHCDGWTGLKGIESQLTEEQYKILQDFTILQSYYA